MLDKYVKAILYLAPFEVVLLYFTDSTSIKVYIFSILCIFVFNKFLLKENPKESLAYYHHFLLFAIFFYVIFKYQIPSYMGTSGPEGIGTDDNTFYGQLREGDVTYAMEVPAEYKYPFSIFLQFIFPFKATTPLSVTTFTILFVSYLPYYIKKISDILFNDERISKCAIFLIITCPFIVYYSSIIMRDMLITTLIFAGLYYYLRKGYLGLAISILLIVWIRFGSIVFLAAGIIVIIISRMKEHRMAKWKIVFLLLCILLLFYFAFPYLQEYSYGRLSNNLIRDTNGDYFKDSTIAKLVNMPFPINIILSTIFFIYIPLFQFPILVDGHFYSGGIMQGTLTPLFFFFVWNYFYNALFSLFSSKNRSLVILFALMILFAMLLGTISLQSRHKTVLIPLLCLFSSYGVVRYNKSAQSISILLAVGTIAVQIIYSILMLF